MYMAVNSSGMHVVERKNRHAEIELKEYGKRTIESVTMHDAPHGIPEGSAGAPGAVI
eukprot:CAMPEP_0170167790 /NCGR_PEP_ID=MMETSP0040_2-20121228/1094_1 /TAXON_ID=641309 /ORGANISM="Lotharella oceanica, Strain CCMP622" /LENGTH=56 /DNA_ID=CAMNT_0010405921 /DNA_START=418 /DNA_END=585 /DNA_ORIENTATION=-